MEHLGTGAGLAALGFWTFIAAAVAASYWDKIRKREAQHETLRRVIESGQAIDEELTDKLLMISGDARDYARDLKVAGLITLFVAPGLWLFGWLLSAAVGEPQLVGVFTGIAALVAFISIGLLVGAYVAERQYGDGGRAATR